MPKLSPQEQAARRARIARRARAKAKAKAKTQENLLKTYANLYKEQRITYNGREIKSKGKNVSLNIDVRNFIQPDQFVLNFAKVSGALSSKDIDEKAWLVQKAVCKYMTYVYDEKNTGYTEFWQFPFETLALRCGDCEDGAILIASAMIAAGVPRDRVRVYAGWVKTGDSKEPWGGHGYVAYLRMSDTQPVPLDWCYYEDPNVPINKKPTLTQNKNYGEVWFSFHDQKSWGQKPVRFSSRKHLEDKFKCTLSQKD